MAHAELRISHRLPDQFFAVEHETRETPAVCALGRRLRLNPAANIRLVKLFSRKQSQLLVGVVKLQFALAHFERLPMPLAELLGEPDRMLLRGQNVKQVWGRVDALATGQ